MHLLALVVGLDDLAAVAFLGRLGGDLDLAFADREADRAVTLIGHKGHAADGRAHLVEIEDRPFVVVLRHDHLVVREVAGELSRDQQAAFGLEEDVVRVLAKRDLALAAGQA